MGLLGLLASVAMLTAFQIAAGLKAPSWVLPSAELTKPMVAATQKTDGLTHRKAHEFPNRSHDAASLPDALSPITFHGCCAVQGEGMKSYDQVCNTEKACEKDSLYPYSSVEEADRLAPWDPTVEELSHHKRACSKANKQPAPEIKWCRCPLQDGAANIESAGNRTYFPFGCSRYGMQNGTGPYDRILLFPEHKLAFCGIPKVGITPWVQFLRFTLGAKDYRSDPHKKRDAARFRFDILTPQTQQEIWEGNWKKAVFVRDPAERLLSAYLDKIEKDRKYIRDEVTFSEFIDRIALTNVNLQGKSNTGLSWKTDSHWRPQSWSCGLWENLTDFEVVGSLDDAARDSKALLEKLTMWEQYGCHFRISDQQIPPGFQQQQSRVAKEHDHSTGARSRLDEYYTPEIMSRVRKLYWMDFELWGAVQKAGKEKTSTGRDVASLLNSDCASCG